MAASPQDIQKLNERIVAIFTQFKEYEKKEFRAMLAENVSTVLEGTNKVLEMTAKILEQEIKVLDESSKLIKEKKKNEQIEKILIAQAFLSGGGSIAKIAKNILSYQAAGLKAKSDYTMEMINNNPDLYDEIQNEITKFKSKDILQKVKTLFDEVKKDNTEIDTIWIKKKFDPVDETTVENAKNKAAKAKTDAEAAYGTIGTTKVEDKDKAQIRIIRKKAAEAKDQLRIAEMAEKAKEHRAKSVETADAIIKAFTTIQAVYNAHPNELKTLYAESVKIKTLADAIKTESPTYITKDAYPKCNYALKVAKDLSDKIATSLNVVAFVKNLNDDEKKALESEVFALVL